MEEESVLVRILLIFGISKLGKGDMIVMFSSKIGDIISRDVVLTQKFSLVVAGCYTYDRSMNRLSVCTVRVCTLLLRFVGQVVLSSSRFLLLIKEGWYRVVNGFIWKKTASLVKTKRGQYYLSGYRYLTINHKQ